MKILQANPLCVARGYGKINIQKSAAYVWGNTVRGCMNMKRTAYLLFACVLCGVLLLSGCASESGTAMTPENVLEKAFQKDQQTFSEAFGVDFSTDAELIYGQPDNYRLTDAVELYGRTADRTDLYFVEDELLQFEYQFAFSGGEQALAEALDFAKKRVEESGKAYGDSILKAQYAVSEDTPLLADYEAAALYEQWAQAPDQPHNAADAFAVSEDCVLEITLTTFDNSTYVVALSYKRPVEKSMP